MTATIEELEKAIIDADHRCNLAEQRYQEAACDRAKAVSATVKAREALKEAKQQETLKKLFWIDLDEDPSDLQKNLLSAGVRIDMMHPPGFLMLVRLTFEGCEGHGEGPIFLVALQKAARALLRR